MASHDALRRSLKFKLKLILSENKILIQTIEEHVKKAEAIYRDTESLEKISTKVFKRAMARLERAYSACIKLILLASDLFESDKENHTDNLAASQSVSQHLEDSACTNNDSIRSVDKETMRRLSSLERKFHRYVAMRGQEDLKGAPSGGDVLKDLPAVYEGFYQRMMTTVERPEVYCASDPVIELRRFLYGLDNQNYDGYRDPRIILSNERKKFPNETVSEEAKGSSHASHLMAATAACGDFRHGAGAMGDGEKNVPVEALTVDGSGTADEDDDDDDDDDDRNCNDVGNDYQKSLRGFEKDCGDNSIHYRDNPTLPLVCDNLESERNIRNGTPSNLTISLNGRDDSPHDEDVQGTLTAPHKLLRTGGRNGDSPHSQLELDLDHNIQTVQINTAMKSMARSPSQLEKKIVHYYPERPKSFEKIQEEKKHKYFKIHNHESVQNQNHQETCTSLSGAAEKTRFKFRDSSNICMRERDSSPAKISHRRPRSACNSPNNATDVISQKSLGSCLHNFVRSPSPGKAKGFFFQLSKDSQSFQQCPKVEEDVDAQRSNICNHLPTTSPRKMQAYSVQCAGDKEETGPKKDNVQSILERIRKMEHFLEHEISTERCQLLQCLKDFEQLLGNVVRENQTETLSHKATKEFCEDERCARKFETCYNDFEIQAQISKVVCSEIKIPEGQSTVNCKSTCRALAKSPGDEKAYCQSSKRKDKIRHGKSKQVNKSLKPKQQKSRAFHQIKGSNSLDYCKDDNTLQAGRDLSEPDSESCDKREPCVFCRHCLQCNISDTELTSCSLTGGSTCETDSDASDSVKKMESDLKQEDGEKKLSMVEQDGGYRITKQASTPEGNQRYEPDNLNPGCCQKRHKQAVSVEKSLRKRIEQTRKAMLHLMVAGANSHIKNMSSMGEYEHNASCDHGRLRKCKLIPDCNDEQTKVTNKIGKHKYVNSSNINDAQEKETAANEETLITPGKGYNLLGCGAPSPNETGYSSNQESVQNVHHDFPAGFCEMPPELIFNSHTVSQPSELLLCSTHPPTAQPCLLWQPQVRSSVGQTYQPPCQFSHFGPPTDFSPKQKPLRRGHLSPSPAENITKGVVIGSAERVYQNEVLQPIVLDRVPQTCLDYSDTMFYEPTNVNQPSLFLAMQKVCHCNAVSQNDFQQHDNIPHDEVPSMKYRACDKLTRSELSLRQHQITVGGRVTDADGQGDNFSLHVYPQLSQVRPQPYESVKYIGMQQQQQQQQQQQNQYVQVGVEQSQPHFDQYREQTVQTPHVFIQHQFGHHPPNHQQQMEHNVQHEHQPLQQQKLCQPHQSLDQMQRHILKADEHRTEQQYRGHSSPRLRLPNSCPAMVLGFCSAGSTLPEQRTPVINQGPQLNSSGVPTKSAKIIQTTCSSFPSSGLKTRRVSKSRSRTRVPSKKIWRDADSGTSPPDKKSSSRRGGKPECLDSNQTAQASLGASAVGGRNSLASRRAMSQGYCGRTKTANRTVCITNLPPQLEEVQLLKVLNQHGFVSRIYFIKHRSTGEFQGTAYVKFRQSAEAESAVSALNRLILEGQKVTASVVCHGSSTTTT